MIRLTCNLLFIYQTNKLFIFNLHRTTSLAVIRNISEVGTPQPVTLRPEPSEQSLHETSDCALGKIECDAALFFSCHKAE